MTNKRTTSVPLFGSATPREVEAIQKEMNAFTAKLVKKTDQARKLLEETGAIAPEGKEQDRDIIGA